MVASLAAIAREYLRKTERKIQARNEKKDLGWLFL